MMNVTIVKIYQMQSFWPKAGNIILIFKAETTGTLSKISWNNNELKNSKNKYSLKPD